MIASHLRHLSRNLLVKTYGLQLRLASAGAHGPEDWLRIANDLRLGPLRIQPMQVGEEIHELLTTLQRRPPRRLLEVGTARGGTLFLFCRAAAADAHAISIDLPGGRFGGGYPAWKEPLYRSFAGPSQRVDLVRGDSRDPVVVDRVDDLLQGPLDFLYIDGDHRYAGVRGDFETYFPRLRPGGLVAFHDIRPGDPRYGGDVPQLWSELKVDFPHHEILADGHQGFGIGLLWKPGSGAAEVNGG